METTITITHENKKELIDHLKVILKTIRECPKDVIEDGTSFEDNNCYGTHEVTIDPD